MLVSRRILSAVIILSLAVMLLAAILVPAAAASNSQQIIIDDVTVSHTFGTQIVFKLAAHSPTEITGATLLMRSGVDARTDVLPAVFTTGTRIEAEAVRDLQTQPIPPFANIIYSWRLTDSNGDTFNTPEQTYHYDDNRFTWETASRGPIHTHWHNGDIEFGQAIADIGYEALTRVSRLMNITPPDSLDIYVYESVADLQAGLSLGGRTWVGGHADPTLGVVMIYGAPDQFELVRLESDLSHELAHVLVYQVVGAGYVNMPIWLDEGIATTAELQPDANYTDALNTAVNTDALLPLDSLCGSFGVDGSRVILAYAQSASIVRYIQDQWGPATLRDLLYKYRDGASCQGGVQSVLNMSLAELQTNWERDVLRASPLNSLFKQLFPYLIIFGPITLIIALLIFVPRPRPDKPKLAAAK
jgi:Peptidase MA superfamily